MANCPNKDTKCTKQGEGPMKGKGPPMKGGPPGKGSGKKKQKK